MFKATTFSGIHTAAAKYARRCVDFISDTRNLMIVPDGGEIVMASKERDVQQHVGPLTISDLAHGQLATWAKIPKRQYYDRLREEHPALLAHNLTYFFNNTPANRMVRCLRPEMQSDGTYVPSLTTARGFLSDRYQRIDHLDVLGASEAPLVESGYKITEATITDRRLYLKAVIERDYQLRKVGEWLRRGVTIRNSELAQGAYEVAIYVLVLSCMNGMSFEDQRVRKYHVGSAQDTGLLSEETLIADQRVFLMKGADTIRNFANPDTFEKLWTNLNNAVEAEVEKPIAASRFLANKLGMTEDETSAMQERLVAQADSTVWGLTQALTFTAHEIDDYDRQHELELAAGRLLETPAAWKELQSVEAAA